MGYLVSVLYKYSMIKVLFINAINPLSEIERRYPNLGLGYLVSSLRKEFGQDKFESKIIDSDVEKTLKTFKPDIVGITSVTQNYNIAKRYATIANRLNIPVLIGGLHISMLPVSLTDNMNIGVIGEGEITIKELFSIFLDKGRFVAGDLLKKKGVVFWEDNTKTFSQTRQDLIEDIDSIPFPARDLLKIERHSYIFSSRGCPYRCVFCASSRFWDEVRFFSAEYVVSEIEELVERYNVRLISFYDDLFIANKKRLERIVELLRKKRFYKKVKFTCSARANLITKEIAKLLKEMHVLSVGMGLESGSDEILKFLKGNITVEDNKKAVSILRRYGINVNASFVIGSPKETEDEMIKTYYFIKNNPLSLVDTYVLTPYPGTPLWDYAKERELVSDDMDWSRFNVNFNVNYKRAVILSEILKEDDIIRIYKKFARQRFFRNIKNIWNSPFLLDLSKVAFGIFKESVAKITKKSYQK